MGVRLDDFSHPAKIWEVSVLRFENENRRGLENEDDHFASEPAIVKPFKFKYNDSILTIGKFTILCGCPFLTDLYVFALTNWAQLV